MAAHQIFILLLTTLITRSESTNDHPSSGTYSASSSSHLPSYDSSSGFNTNLAHKTTYGTGVDSLNQPDTSLPGYYFQYEEADENGDLKRQGETREGETVKGFFTVVDSGGSHRTTEYTADHERGFYAIMHREKASYPQYAHEYRAPKYGMPESFHSVALPEIINSTKPFISQFENLNYGPNKPIYNNLHNTAKNEHFQNRGNTHLVTQNFQQELVNSNLGSNGILKGISYQNPYSNHKLKNYEQSNLNPKNEKGFIPNPYLTTPKHNYNQNVGIESTNIETPNYSVKDLLHPQYSNTQSSQPLHDLVKYDSPQMVTTNKGSDHELPLYQTNKHPDQRYTTAIFDSSKSLSPQISQYVPVYGNTLPSYQVTKNEFSNNDRPHGYTQKEAATLTITNQPQIKQRQNTPMESAHYGGIKLLQNKNPETNSYSHQFQLTDEDSKIGSNELFSTTQKHIMPDPSLLETPAYHYITPIRLPISKNNHVHQQNASSEFNNNKERTSGLNFEAAKDGFIYWQLYRKANNNITNNGSPQDYSPIKKDLRNYKVQSLETPNYSNIQQQITKYDQTKDNKYFSPTNEHFNSNPSKPKTSTNLVLTSEDSLVNGFQSFDLFPSSTKFVEPIHEETDPYDSNFEQNPHDVRKYNYDDLPHVLEQSKPEENAIKYHENNERRPSNRIQIFKLESQKVQPNFENLHHHESSKQLHRPYNPSHCIDESPNHLGHNSQRLKKNTNEAYKLVLVPDNNYETQQNQNTYKHHAHSYTNNNVQLPTRDKLIFTDVPKYVPNNPKRTKHHQIINLSDDEALSFLNDQHESQIKEQQLATPVEEENSYQFPETSQHTRPRQKTLNYNTIVYYPHQRSQNEFDEYEDHTREQSPRLHYRNDGFSRYFKPRRTYHDNYVSPSQLKHNVGPKYISERHDFFVPNRDTRYKLDRSDSKEAVYFKTPRLHDAISYVGSDHNNDKRQYVRLVTSTVHK